MVFIADRFAAAVHGVNIAAAAMVTVVKEAALYTYQRGLVVGTTSRLP